MITALYNVKNDVESQCDVIRALNKLNAAGLIVFYYGLVVQKFDQRVLDLCDELNFRLLSSTIMTISTFLMPMYSMMCFH